MPAPAVLGPSPRRMKCASGHVLRSASRIAIVLRGVRHCVGRLVIPECTIVWHSLHTTPWLKMVRRGLLWVEIAADVHVNRQLSFITCRNGMNVAALLRAQPGPRHLRTRSWAAQVGTQSAPVRNQRRVCWPAVVSCVGVAGCEVISTLQNHDRSIAPGCSDSSSRFWCGLRRTASTSTHSCALTGIGRGVAPATDVRALTVDEPRSSTALIRTPAP